MKKSKIIGLALAATLIGFVGFYSCEKTYVEPVTSTTTLKNPTLALAPGGWKITSFQWHDKSDNSQFIDYRFKFNTDGSVTAVHNHVVEYGKWSLRNNTTVMFAFSADPLSELSNNWTVVSHTLEDIELRGLSPIDNSTEFLLLSKVSPTGGEIN